MSYVQTDRPISITTPLGADTLLLRSFTGHEAISQLFRFDLDLISEKDSVSFDSIVGKDVTLKVILADGSERYWHGFISRFSQGAQDRRFTTYHAEMVPWLWFLTRTADCRIFQNKTAPDIIKTIFSDLGFNDFSMKLQGSFVQRDYCVQYRETDFNFVSRLMEEEGIFYFFEHAQGKHKMILANDPSAHAAVPKQATARYELSSGGWRDEDVITQWTAEQEFRPGAWAHTDYNFETPSTNLLVKAAGNNKYEIYDHPGEYMKRADGDGLARIRLEETMMPRIVMHGAGDCRAFLTGYKFDLIDHYRIDLNTTYLLTAIRHSATLGDNFETSSGGSGVSQPAYHNSFECIPIKTVFRPPRVTPHPIVQGCQSAVVVGPSGEEIYTDKYGRVKVQFHWDREGKLNENSSCWIRVSMPWAGKGWGGVQIPRIGQEVVVDFLEGNPDQPIIIGRVYNAQQMPPFGLPAGAVISGFKSNSTKGGGGYNEISLNDTKGTELIQVHAQYDQDIKVEHDERTNVGHDRTESVGNDEKITIGHDRTEKVGNNETITIGVDRTEKVGSNEKITIGSNRTENVGSNETIGIGSNRTETVGSNESVTISLMRTHNVGVNDTLNVGAAQEITIGGLQTLTVGVTRAKTVGTSETETIGTSQTTTIGTSQTTKIGTTQTVNVGTDLTESVGKNLTQSVAEGRTASVGKDDSVKVGKNLVVDAGDSIVLKTGDATITMKKDGTITIKGKDITIQASGKISEKADGDIVLKGSKIGLN